MFSSHIFKNLNYKQMIEQFNCIVNSKHIFKDAMHTFS